MIIRYAKLPDLSTILEMCRKFFVEHDEYSYSRINRRKKGGYNLLKDRLETAIRSSIKCIIVAEEGDVIVGMLMVVIKNNGPLSSISHHGFLSLLYVEKTSRRQGIATSLVDFAGGWLKKKKVRQIRLAVNWENRSAIKLYERLGLEKGHVEYLGNI